jgi:hypothetical protein
VFDHVRPIDRHFAGQKDNPLNEAILESEAYQRLEAEIGPCGTAEVAGASVAAPYVSALAAAVAISRLIAVASGCACPTNEVRPRRRGDVARRITCSRSDRYEHPGVALRDLEASRDALSIRKNSTPSKGKDG